MAALSSSTAKTLTLTTSDLFLSSYESFSRQTPPPNPPLRPLTLLSQNSPLPPIPSDFPASKLIPKTRFVVDGFKLAGDFSISYFLSHFHSDHYAGLNPNWCNGLIFCSEITSRLLVESLKVSSHFVVSLAVGETVKIDEREVTLVDANHCPGAVQFLIRVPVIDGPDERYVHTGDFRYCDSMKLDSSLREFVGADAVFLDTTYCNPKFVFPSQEESIDYIVNAIKRIRTENEGATSSVLFLIATYVVGKERILLEVARRCNCLVHVDVKKMAILCTLGFGDSGFFTEDVLASDVDVISWNLLGETWPYFRPNFVKMEEIMVERGFSRAVGFVPTGWTYRAKKEGFAVRAKGSLEIHLVPYSEHSSYSELREYVSFLRPKQVIPTVGLDIENLDSKHVIAMRKHFVGLVNETANKHDFLKVFYSRSSDTNGTDREGVEIDSNEGGDTKGVSLECLEVNLESGFDVEFVPLEQKNSSAKKDEGREEIVQEIRDCLPVWVTRDQMLDLLKRSGGDIVEAVSDFYERETELHEQVKTRNISVSRAEIGSMSESTSNPGFRSAKDTTPGESIMSQDTKSGNLNLLTDTLSPRKRGAKFDKKVKKKSRPISALDASGCKQSTITKFFGKITHDASQVTSTCNSITDQCRTDGSNLHCEDVESYKEEMDQFQQILNGSVSRKHTATLLEKANGDVNLALDMYYSNSIVVLGSVDESLKTNNEPRPIQSDVINDCCTEKGIANISNSSVLGPSTEDLNATYTSLPLEKYSPVEHACWRAGQPAPYLHLARTFDLVEHEKSKIKATGMLCNMFRSLLALSPKDVLPAAYLCTNKIAADHENMELNIGGSLVSAALEEACGTNKSKIRDMYNNLGDLGDVAQVCRQTQSLLAAPRPISIQQLFSILRKMSVESGNGSTARKKNLVVNLMRSCREKEIKFLVRTLVRNLRIGAMMKTVLPALAQAVVLNTSPQLLEGVVERLKEQFQSISGAVVEAYHILPNLDLLVPSLLIKGIDFSSTTLSMTPGIPIRPMLARITNGVNQALALFQGRAFTCEFKYDGQRAQIHKLADGSIQVFSRSGEESTSRFPDLVNMIKESCKPDSKTFVLDAEVVAVDRKNRNKLMAFQQLCSRERGSKDSSIAVNSIKIEICVFIFDIMFLNGEKLLTYTLRQRRKYLEDLFLDEKLGYLEFAKQITVEADEACLTVQTTLTKLSSFLEDAFNSSCEGIIVKSLDDGGYAASKRSNTWLKVKRDYLEGLSDTLDLVPIGAWHGNGRKAGWYSPFLMACYNPDTEEFQSVCRVMSGFSDSFYVEMKEFFSDEKILSRKPPYYQTGEDPDVWFSSELVWAIRGADFTISPVHQAAVGLVHPSRGISIRFPRFIRSVIDRKPEDCCNAGDIADMFRSQNRKMDVSIDN